MPLFYRRNTRYAQGMKEDMKSSHALDLVTVFEGTGTTAEMEAIGLQTLLEAEGIRVVLGGETAFPNLPWTIGVPRQEAQRARQLIRDAATGGSKAAAEAERKDEGSR